MKALFVSGIDTGVGKSVACGWLARRIAANGGGVITQKLIQTGCAGISEDVIAHRRIMGLPLLPDDMDGTTCRYVLKYPASPHLACAMENLKPDFNLLHSDTEKLAKKYGTVIVEGAGGLLVPLGDAFLTADYIVEHSLPLILVASSRLGSLNHALMSLECAGRRGITLAGVVYNTYPSAPRPIEDSTRSYLKSYLAKNFPEAEFMEMGRVDFE